MKTQLSNRLRRLLDVLQESYGISRPDAAQQIADELDVSNAQIILRIASGSYRPTGKHVRISDSLMAELEGRHALALRYLKAYEMACKAQPRTVARRHACA